jgi:hypothetical protein
LTTESDQVTEPKIEEANPPPVVGDESQAVPSVTEQITAETVEDVFQHPLVKERMQEQTRRAEQRSRDRTLSDQRKRFNDPTIVESELRKILTSAGADDSALDANQLRRGAQSLGAAMRDAAADSIASEIPPTFLNNYELSQETLADYQEHSAAGRTDEAFQALIDGAVSSKETALNATFDDRVKAEAGTQARRELEAASENGTAPIPATTRGDAAPNTGISFTSAELEKIPGTTWSGLKQETKDAIYAGVANADSHRGADTVDANRLAQVASLVQ